MSSLCPIVDKDVYPTKTVENYRENIHLYPTKMIEKSVWDNDIADFMNLLCEKISDSKEYREGKSSVWYLSKCLRVKLTSKEDNQKYDVILKSDRKRKHTHTKIELGSQNIFVEKPISYFLSLVPDEYMKYSFNSCILEKDIDPISDIFSQRNSGDFVLQCDINSIDYTEHSEDLFLKRIASFKYYNNVDNRIHYCTLIQNRFMNRFYDYTLNKYYKVGLKKQNFKSLMEFLKYLNVYTKICEAFNIEMLPYNHLTTNLLNDLIKENVLSHVSLSINDKWDVYRDHYRYDNKYKNLYIKITLYRNKTILRIEGEDFIYPRQDILFKQLKEYFNNKDNSIKTIQKFI